MNENSYNRIAKALMDQGMSYETALRSLSDMRLRIVCGSEIHDSAAQQAGLLTAINAGKRAFLAGVVVEMPDDVQPLIPWPGASQTLNKIVSQLGGTRCDIHQGADVPVLIIGDSKAISTTGLYLHCDGWRGGVSPAEIGPAAFVPRSDFALGGVLAAALGVGQLFLKATGLRPRACDEVVGVSAWRPDLNFLDPRAVGPTLEALPKNLWMLGLGHLGQAYLWCLGLLPYECPRAVTVLLQDFDRLVEANWSAGLLTEKFVANRYKTRHCAAWLEERGFETVISERKYDEHTIRAEGEPYLALCGFDNAAARIPLERSGFDLILEAALGGQSHSFDRVLLHTFPGSYKTPPEHWSTHGEKTLAATPELIDAVKEIEDCGILAMTLANKAISASFVGALAGGLVIGEALRACHGGVRCEILNGQLRCFDDRAVSLHKCGNYSKELARNGTVAAMRVAANVDKHGIATFQSAPVVKTAKSKSEQPQPTVPEARQNTQESRQ